MAGNPSGDQTWIADFRTIMFRVDHQWTDKFKTNHQLLLAASSRDPELRRSAADATPSTIRGYRRKRMTSISATDFFQRIATHHATQQFDYIIKNNLLYHATVSWDRWYMGGTPISAGVDWPDKLWGTDRSGLLDKTAGPPNITFTGNIPYTQLGMQWTGSRL